MVTKFDENMFNGMLQEAKEAGEIILGKEEPEIKNIRYQTMEVRANEKKWVTLDNCNFVGINGVWFYPQEEEEIED